MHDILPHTVTTAVRKNKYQLERAIEVGVPCRVSFASALFVLEVLLKMIIPDWFQYAASAGLSTWIVTTKQPDRTIIKEELAEKVPWQLTGVSDGTSESDNDPAVERTVETLAVVRSDGLKQRQEKEAGSVGGIPSQ